MGKLLSEYDMENTILLEVQKLRSIAMAMRFCNFNLLIGTNIRSIGKVILDYLKNIDDHINNDCIHKNEEEADHGQSQQ